MRNHGLLFACSAAILGTLAFAPTTYGDAEEMEMWRCSPPGQRQTTLHLADWGPKSYIKIQGQRVPATCSHEGTDRRWDWAGGNVLILSEDGTANYFKGGDTTSPAGTFRCR